MLRLSGAVFQCRFAAQRLIDELLVLILATGILDHDATLLCGALAAAQVTNGIAWNVALNTDGIAHRNNFFRMNSRVVSKWLVLKPLILRGGGHALGLNLGQSRAGYQKG